MIVKEQKPIEFINTCGAIYKDALLKKAVLWFAQEPVVSKKKVFLWGKYPAIAVRKHKLHIHRLIVSYLWGGLPKDAYVHHIDGNKLNAKQENLGLMTSSMHQRMTNLGRKQTKEHVAKRTASMRKTRYENPSLIN